MNKRDALCHIYAGAHAMLYYFECLSPLKHDGKGMELKEQYKSLKDDAQKTFKTTIDYDSLSLKTLNLFYDRLVNINNNLLKLCNELKIPTKERNWLQNFMQLIIDKIKSIFEGTHKVFKGNNTNYNSNYEYFRKTQSFFERQRIDFNSYLELRC